MAYHLSYENSGFVLTFTGVTTLDEINEINSLIHNHKSFNEHRFQLVDLLEADFSEIDQREAEVPAALDWAAANTNAGVKVALVACEISALEFARNYIETSKEFGSPWQFESFGSLKKAYEWIEYELTEA